MYIAKLLILSVVNQWGAWILSSRLLLQVCSSKNGGSLLICVIDVLDKLNSYLTVIVVHSNMYIHVASSPVSMIYFNAQKIGETGDEAT